MSVGVDKKSQAGAMISDEPYNKNVDRESPKTPKEQPVDRGGYRNLVRQLTPIVFNLGRGM